MYVHGPAGTDIAHTLTPMLHCEHKYRVHAQLFLYRD